jgi:hypothetical protein
MLEIEKMIEAAFKELLELDFTGETIKYSSKLIFPQTRGGKKRVSEQEIRFLFASKLERPEQTQYVYAVEVPTEKTYRFTGDGAPKISKEGKSGSIDMCLYNKADISKPVCLIEFKAHNPKENSKQKSYSKDFLKLMCDKNGLTNYFVQVIKSSNSKTIPNIVGKYEEAVTYAEQQTSNLKIFLCDMGEKTITIYEVINKVVNKIKEIKV